MVINVHKLLNCKSNGDKSQGLGVKHIIIDMEYTKEYKYWVYHRIMSNPKDKPFLLAHLKLLDEILKEIINL